jgi:hypothetical protein
MATWCIPIVVIVGGSVITLVSLFIWSWLTKKKEGALEASWDTCIKFAFGDALVSTMIVGPGLGAAYFYNTEKHEHGQQVSALYCYVIAVLVLSLFYAISWAKLFSKGEKRAEFFGGFFQFCRLWGVGLPVCTFMTVMLLLCLSSAIEGVKLLPGGSSPYVKTESYD